MSKKLSDTIWETRKCRINAEERLLWWKRYTEITLIYFALIPILISIANQDLNYNWLNTASFAISVIVFAISIYISREKFAENAIKFKNNYIELQSMYYDCLKAEKADSQEQLDAIFKEYNTSLDKLDNQSSIDYLKLQHSVFNDKQSTVTQLTGYGHKMAFVQLVLMPKVLLPLLTLFSPVLIIVLFYYLGKL